MSLARCFSVLLVAAAAAVGCGGDERAQRTSPVAPSVVSGASGAATPATATGGVPGPAAPATSSTPVPLTPAELPTSGARDVAFPPRDQPLDFRVRLETKYRDQLQRPSTSSYVDLEGNIVWTQEYLRYRVNACDHTEAVSRVLMQLDGLGIQPVCGSAPPGNVEFPPRDQPFDFRQQLESYYRTRFGRQPTATHVDVEGDIVWTQEYLRYRVNGCDHLEAVDRVFQQIDGRGIQPVCQTIVVPPPTPQPPPTPEPPGQATQTYTGEMNGIESDGQGGTKVPYNLTVLLRLLAGGSGNGGAGTRATPLYQVTGTYEAADGRTGTVTGELVGLPSNGDFRGSLRCEKSGCVASRPFTGTLTTSSIAWGASGPPANT
jgi:hypothetical protein